MATDVPLAVSTLRQIITSDASWVLCAQGTVIFLPTDGIDPQGRELEGAAKNLLREQGPVHAGSSAADFGTITLPDDLGWIVTYDFPDMLTLVLPLEGQGDESDFAVGLLGRSKREQDALELQVVHIERRGDLAL